METRWPWPSDDYFIRYGDLWTFAGNLGSVTNEHEYPYHESAEIYGDRVPRTYPVPRRINLISIVPLTICRQGRFSKSILSNPVSVCPSLVPFEDTSYISLAIDLQTPF